MANRFITRANKKVGFGWAAGLLAASSMIAQALGLLRDRFLYGGFQGGVRSPEVSAFKAAFAVPDFMFFLLISGALAVTFIPVFNERYLKGNKKSAWELSSSLFNMFTVLTFVSSLLMLIFAEPLIKYVVAPGLDEQTTFLAVSMMRVVAVNPLLFSASSVLASMQQAVGRFVFVSLAPSIYNLSIIIGLIFLAPNMGIMGVAFGVVIGAILQLIVSAIGMSGLGFVYRPKIFWRNRGFQRVLNILPARSLDQGIDYFQNLVETNLASRLGAGSIGVYSAAYTLHQVPITLVGVAISTAAFPRLTERLAQGRQDLFKADINKLLRLVIWFSLPLIVGTFLMRGYLVRLLTGAGYTQIATVLGIFAWAILFRALYHVLSRSFYAQQDTKTPLYISFVAIGLNIILAIAMARPEFYGIYGLPIAQVIVAFIEVAILLTILLKRFPGIIDKTFVEAVWRMLSAFGITFVIAWIVRRELLELGVGDRGFLEILPKLTILTLVIFATYLLLSWVFKLEEAKPFLDKIKTILFKPIRIE